MCFLFFDGRTANCAMHRAAGVKDEMNEYARNTVGVPNLGVNPPWPRIPFSTLTHCVDFSKSVKSAVSGRAFRGLPGLSPPQRQARSSAPLPAIHSSCA
jgi:hypothetical protein